MTGNLCYISTIDATPVFEKVSGACGRVDGTAIASTNLVSKGAVANVAACETLCINEKTTDQVDLVCTAY